MRKQDRKPIICCFAGGEKLPKPSQKNGRRKPDIDQEQRQDFWIKDLSTTSKFEATKNTALNGISDTLISASLIGSFAWPATLLFWLFGDCWPGHW